MPQPLQHNPFDIVTQTQYHNVYAACLAFEAAATTGTPPIQVGGIDTLVLARVLGYILIHAPNDTTLTNLSNEIADAYAMGLEALADLGLHYINVFIRCFKRANGRTPAPSEHPSRPSFDDTRDFMMHISQQSPKDHQTVKRLVRPFLSKSHHKDPAHEAHAGYLAALPNRTSSTECAHIIPDYVNRDISGPIAGGSKHHHTSTVWAVLSCLGLTFGWEELIGNEIHRVENVLTLDPTAHSLFDNLDLWLDAL
ncbi:hypothetical protein SERLA73DRAFT_74721 [Serpula lacrymans var. lacrymans S7.3]|uniref:HNH nuclease domain-containing protein n=2 Tax=Serpula lacrymans var. lacrymans TaxID=341189 RepID=F8Q049_SERL3|nr:uncharacterized protein SERLADRAFT_439398 [Serpula lacrymans var. lacrymans S7.9]EGN98521.1 hypothetical protein SERLA73DRAFT_74721 [Serpula lacrymans var. lacrymans S7.3]EGO24091.1 hypothetical protein SERLADRAFT_439398 [Serpula lacrymans var. lacrymans S7.9]